MSHEAKFPDATVTVTVDGDPAARVRLIPTGESEVSAQLSFCCVPHLLGVIACLEEAIRVVQFALFENGLAADRPDGTEAMDGADFPF